MGGHMTHQKNRARTNHCAENGDDKPSLVVLLDKEVNYRVADCGRDHADKYQADGIIDLEHPQKNILDRR